MFFRSVWCSLGLKIWAGEPKSVGSNPPQVLKSFYKTPTMHCSIKPFNIPKWKMLTTSTNHDHNKRSSLLRPNSLHLHKALLKVWLQWVHWTLVPKLKVLSVALHSLIHSHAICTTPKWIMRQEALNWIVMACVWGGSHHAHVCVARVLNQNPWHH